MTNPQLVFCPNGHHELGNDIFYYHGTANDAATAAQRDHRVGDVDHGLAIGISLNVAEITSMTTALRVSGGSVLAAVGVEVRSGRRAAVRVIAELVNVEPVGSRSEPGDLAAHSNRTVTLKIAIN